MKTLEDIVLEDLDDNNRGKNGVAQEMEKSRILRPLNKHKPMKMEKIVTRLCTT